MVVSIGRFSGNLFHLARMNSSTSNSGARNSDVVWHSLAGRCNYDFDGGSTDCDEDGGLEFG